MATDLNAITNNLISFFDFTDKEVIHVGAGGGQLLDYGNLAKHIIAIDIDESAIQKLRNNVKSQNLETKCTILKKDFYLLDQSCDVTFFEFCLHEMHDPSLALEHSKKLSPELLIIDHMPDSKWAWYVGETEIVLKSWQAIEKQNIKNQVVVETQQFFRTFQELKEKLSSCGEEVQYRILDFEDQHNFTIPMKYGLVLI